MYIFDTLSHLYAGNKNVLRSLQQLDRATVGTTIITKIEMLRGRIDYLLKADTGSSLRRAQQLSCRTEELLLQTQIIPITDKSIVEFDRLSTSLKYRKIRRSFDDRKYCFIKPSYIGHSKLTAFQAVSRIECCELG